MIIGGNSYKSKGWAIHNIIKVANNSDLFKNRTYVSDNDLIEHAISLGSGSGDVLVLALKDLAKRLSELEQASLKSPKNAKMRPITSQFILSNIDELAFDYDAIEKIINVLTNAKINFQMPHIKYSVNRYRVVDLPFIFNIDDAVSEWDELVTPCIKKYMIESEKYRTKLANFIVNIKL